MFSPGDATLPQYGVRATGFGRPLLPEKLLLLKAFRNWLGRISTSLREGWVVVSCKKFTGFVKLSDGLCCIGA